LQASIVTKNSEASGVLSQALLVVGLVATADFLGTIVLADGCFLGFAFAAVAFLTAAGEAEPAF
jgi:hypothetical protein